MQTTDRIDVLNRLLQTLFRSLPVYLDMVWNEPPEDPDDIAQAIINLAHDQADYARRVARAVSNLGDTPDAGHFPARFGAMHDLEMRFLLGRVIEFQEHAIAEMRRCREQLAGAPRLEALADEILGNAQGHLENLRKRSETAIAS
jgi:hypothetical protein